MKTTKRRKSKPVRRSGDPVKPVSRSSNILKSHPKKLSARGKPRATTRSRLEGLVWNLDNSVDNLENRLRLQTDELKNKNGQIRNGAVRLQRSDEQVHFLTIAIESAADGVFIIDAQRPDFPIVYANPSFRNMTGYAKREILGRDYFSLYGAKADPRIVEEIKRTLDHGEYFNGELVNFKKNGDKYWSQLRIAPMRGSAKVITHFVGIQADVTLMRQRDLEIKEQRDELLHVTRVGKLAEFVSSLAHEISQPLTAILSYAQAALRILADREPKIREILQYIVDDDQRAVAVIGRMRSLLKKSESEMKPLDLNALVGDTLSLIATDAAVRNCALTADLAPGLPTVRGDRIQLQQVLLNLFSNCFDAMEGVAGTSSILITTSRKDADALLVAVKDSGSGIPPENLSKLFTHFFTSKPDGLGMGLSISRSIVEAHGGRLEGENNPDRGATFHFTLPIARPEVP
jgi:PAS domain S-box-containing protein